MIDNHADPMPILCHSPVACRSAACRAYNTHDHQSNLFSPSYLLDDQTHIIRPSSADHSLLNDHHPNNCVARPSPLNNAHHHIICVRRLSVSVLAQRRTSSFALGQAFSPQQRRTSSFPRPIILGQNPSQNLNDIILCRG